MFYFFLFSSYGEDLPCALVVARLEELQRNQNILYNLVKPTKDNPNLIESNLKLANVLPKNRIYRMESVEEFHLFKEELLKRPLVLQCAVDGGPGITCMKWCPNLDCRIVRFSGDYIVLLNQNHPKILARLQMGLEVAERAMQRSQPFILTFTFNDVMERLYPTILREFDDLIGPKDIVNCHDGEIIIRYVQDNKGLHLKDAIKIKDMTFAFEDIDSLDMKVDTLRCAQARQRRSLPLDQGELVSVLKGWKFGDFDTSQDLVNAYAEISDGPSQLKTNDSVPHAIPPSYESAVLLPVSKPQQPSRQYGYSDSRNHPTKPISHNLSSEFQDRSMTSNSRKVIKPPQYLESEDYPYEVSNEYVNVGFYEDHDNGRQKHRYAAQYFHSDFENNHHTEMQLRNARGDGRYNLYRKKNTYKYYVVRKKTKKTTFDFHISCTSWKDQRLD
ncbi:unnamed protein product [Acanthosepion pharaonis]|uniref:Uncharacterized protein n=1 Tax=Acanthosepion pharaonis TaxID=158019 RepID=A0A812B8B0_ACAPH|nr:unnamed protein product [Sepia pharaonis]